MRMTWRYFDRFEDVTDKYMPSMGEGETMASQICTAVNKLVYKWYNDGDVYDNTYVMDGWCNDLSSYANWLYENAPCQEILDRISNCFSDSEYEKILKDLADKLLDAEWLESMNKEQKRGSIYECDGPFRFVEYDEDEDEEWIEDEDWTEDEDW